MDNLTDKDIQVIFDVLNVYNPDDISHVYPEMGEDKFVREVNEVWLKVLHIMESKDDSNFERMPEDDYTSDGNGQPKKRQYYK